MGKRKRDNDSYEYIAKKIKKLERELERSRRKRSDSLSSSSTRNSRSYIEDCASSVEHDQVVDDVELVELNLPAPVDEPLPSTSSAMPEAIPEQDGNIVEISQPVLDSEILQILGDDPSVVKAYGKDIQADLAVRLQHISTQGLTNESKKELLDRHLPPANCTLIDAPCLNPEIKAALSEPVLKRDLCIEQKQKQLGSAISSIGEALTLLLKNDAKDILIIKLLMDACRIICNCQNMDSLTRRNFILFNLKKDMKDQLLKTKIDKYLFGADLSENIRIAKTISKSGAELKAPAGPSTSRASAPRPHQTPGLSSQVKPQRNNLNWRGPPPSRRQRGNQRTRDPAPRTQPASSFRPSYRPPTTTNRGRR